MSRRWVLSLVALGLMFFAPGAYWSATWLGKWAFLLALGAGFFSIWVARATSLWHLPMLVYVFTSLLALSVWPQSPYQNAVDGVTLLALQKNAYAGLAEWVLALGAVAILCRWGMDMRRALVLVWALGVVGFLWLPLHGPKSAPNNGICFGNPSMGASLLACLLPLVWETTRRKSLCVLAWLATFIAVCKTGASVPWGVLGATTAAYWVSRTYRGRWLLGVVGMVMLAGILIPLGQKLLGADFWDQNRRFEIWGMAWDWFRANGSLLWGMGFSSSQALLPIEQVVTGHFHGDYFLWLHNDWLQLFIEGGLLGAAAITASTTHLLTVSFKKPELFSALVGFVILACFNYPLRMPIHCFCLVLLCALIESGAGRNSPVLA